MKKLPKIAALILTAAIACGCSDLTDSSTVSDTATESTPSVTSDAPDESTKEPETEAPVTETSAPETESPETSAPETSAEESSEAETTAADTEESTTPAPVTDVDSYRAIGDNGILVAGMDGHYRGIMFYGGTYGYCDQLSPM